MWPALDYKQGIILRCKPYCAYWVGRKVNFAEIQLLETVSYFRVGTLFELKCRPWCFPPIAEYENTQCIRASAHVLQRFRLPKSRACQYSTVQAWRCHKHLESNLMRFCAHRLLHIAPYYRNQSKLQESTRKSERTQQLSTCTSSRDT